MSSSGDSPGGDAPSGDTIPAPDDPNRSVRGEIEQFFGAAQPDAGAPVRRQTGFDRLLADLEKRILGSVRKDEPPAEVGPFVLEEVIGRGGFAVVYRATHSRTGARAAVKLVPASDEASHERILIEVDSLIRLSHPNIVRVLDTGEDAGFAWVATDYIEGITLAAFIRSSQADSEDFHLSAGSASQAGAPASRPATGRRASDPATLRRVVSWFRDLAGALQALHEAGLVHRDVKPANIVIDSKDRPFLIDFGLSSSAESTVDGILAGTVPYMSPEQTLGGYVALTAKSDVYSLAATFHEALTGHRVTQGAKRETILHEIAFVQVPPPSHVDSAIPATLDPIFSRALAKDSNQRYASAKHLAEDLDCWLAGQPLRHVTEKLGSRAGRTVRRHPIGVALAALALVAAIAWGAWIWIADKREYEETLRRIRADLDGGRPVAALATLAEKQPAYEDRAEFHQLHREAVMAGAEPFLRAMLETQTFAVQSLAGEATHKRFAGEARSHLSATGIPEPHLVFVVAASQYFSNKADDAAATLAAHRETVERNRFLMEFEAVVASFRHDRSGFEAILARLKQAAPASADPTDACVHALRILSSRDRYPDIRVPAEEVREVEDDLHRCVKGRDHAFARGMLTLLAIERGDYQDALREIRQFAKFHARLADGAGAHVIEASIWMVLAGQTTGQDRETFLATGTSLAKSALEACPEATRRLLHDLKKADLSIRLAWIGTALDDAWSKKPPFDRFLLSFAAFAVRDLAGQGARGRIVEVVHELERQPGFARSVAEPDHLALQKLHLWALRMQRGDLAEKGRLSEARELAARSRSVVGRFRSAPVDIPYRLGVEDAVAEGFVARTESDAATRRIKALEATEHLRKLDDDGVLEDARKKTPDPTERDKLAELRTMCVDELARINAMLEQEQPDSR